MIIDKKYNKIQVMKGGFVEFYNPEVIGSIRHFKNELGEYGVEVDIIGDGRCNRDSFKFLLKNVTNQVTWTDDIAGVNIAVDTIANWADILATGLATQATLQEINLGIPASLGQKTMTSSMPVVIASNQSNGNTTPNYVRVTGSGSIAAVTTSFSVKNIGNANGTFLGATLKAGEPALNFDAGTYRSYIANSFTYDATGTEFLIIYNS
jgi:hypothetical protein